jgi:hypothetical protein
MRAWLRLLAVTALVAVACGSVNPTGIRPGAASGARAPDSRSTPASGARLQSACPAVQSAPQFEAAAPSSRNLAVVWLERPLSRTPQFVVRDITDILHPKTIGTLEQLGAPQFVSAADLSYYDSNALYRVALSGSPKTTVASACNGLFAFAWSSDGRGAAYVTVSSDHSASELHLVAGGIDRAVDSMPPMHIGGCVAPCGDFVDVRLLYSPNGAYISFVSYWSTPLIRIWTSDGKLVKSIDGDPANSRAPTMSVWSGDSLFFRGPQGVEVWRDGTQSLLLPGVAWIRPKASPAGGQVVYVAKDQAGMPNTFILDTVAAKTRMIAKLRSEPAFLNSHLIWYKEERPCRSDDQYPCGLVATIETGKTYIYDLLDNTESESVIAAVWDIWPHAS